ncbi:hypothetical protein XNC3_2450003 [Xenorhabdus nematophila F1]|nr:hypothetical protein XNC3_2450003 [Xenorhabdus nematophila F1]
MNAVEIKICLDKIDQLLTKAEYLGQKIDEIIYSNSQKAA